MEYSAENRGNAADCLPNQDPRLPLPDHCSLRDPNRFGRPATFEQNGTLARIPEGALYVWDANRDIEVGVVLMLGPSGLVFEYFDVGCMVADAGNIDLLTEAGLCISAVPYSLISDGPIEEEDGEPSPIPIRCAHVRFGSLSSTKRNALETLLSIYGKSAA